MQEPVVSLLVPIYNVERYLRECLDSAKNQTLRDIEIICINDGSTDSSPDIIREYMAFDDRFKIIDKSNSGYGSSMNMGLAAAQGKYIGILESDDFFELDALEKLVRKAEEHDAQVVKANFWLYWSVPEEKNELFELVTPEMADRLVNPQKEFDIYYKKPSIWSAVYRRDFIEENGIRFLETPGASYQDAAFNFKVWSSANRVVYMLDAVLHYRQDNEASSVNSPSKVYCVCDEYAEMRRHLEGQPEKEYLIPVLEKMKYDSYMWNYERLGESLGMEFLERMSSEFSFDIAQEYVDLDYFEPWKRVDLALIVESPKLFAAGRKARVKKGPVAKSLVYMQEGGLGLLISAVRHKTNAR